MCSCMLQPADEVVHVHGKDISIQTAMPTHRLINMVYSKPYHFHVFFCFFFHFSFIFESASRAKLPKYYICRITVNQEFNR